MRPFRLALCLAALSAPFASPVAAQSLPAVAETRGGVVRADPSSGSAVLWSLNRGQPLTVLERSEGRMNGHPWFRVRLAPGATGWHWGGRLCTTETRIGGASGKCDNPPTTPAERQGDRTGEITSAVRTIDYDRCEITRGTAKGTFWTRECRGYRGTKLFIDFNDGRYELDAGARRGGTESLSARNELLPSVEWRLEDGAPFAIIYQLLKTGSSREITTVVESLGGDGTPACTVATIGGGDDDALESARFRADRDARADICKEDAAEVEPLPPLAWSRTRGKPPVALWGRDGSDPRLAIGCRRADPMALTIFRAGHYSRRDDEMTVEIGRRSTTLDAVDAGDIAGVVATLPVGNGVINALAEGAEMKISVGDKHLTAPVRGALLQIALDCR